MIVHFSTVTRRKKFGPRNRGIIQERLYKTPADMKRAKTLIEKHFRQIGCYNYNIFPYYGVVVDGVEMEKLYISRIATDKELIAQGLDPDVIYHDMPASCRCKGR